MTIPIIGETDRLKKRLAADIPVLPRGAVITHILDTASILAKQDNVRTSDCLYAIYCIMRDEEQAAREEQEAEDGDKN